MGGNSPERTPGMGEGRPPEAADAETSVRMRHQGLPLSRLIGNVERSSIFYCVTPIDNRGRLADRSPLRIMQWLPMQPIDYTVNSESVTVTESGSGRWAINGQGHLCLPSGIRFTMGVRPVDRLLIAADLQGARLHLFTMDRLDRALGIHRPLRNGDGL